MKRVFDYGRVMDVFNQIIQYRFEPEIRDLTAARFQFESEESHFAPEPSVASRVRAENGCEFGLIYLQRSNVLMVLCELDADRSTSIQTFIEECPELSPHLLRAYPLPHSPVPDDVLRRYIERHRQKTR